MTSPAQSCEDVKLGQTGIERLKAASSAAALTSGALGKKECVARVKGKLDNDSVYQAGRDFADAGRFVEAIDVLTLASNLNDKRILNFLGYSHRKLGRIEVGLGYYREALEIDPEYTLVREYLGEALLQKHDLVGARVQLAEIERLCNGQDCHEFEELAEAIDLYLKNNPE
jgi:tetratricopeptide (TPR) repeat protein